MCLPPVDVIGKAAYSRQWTKLSPAATALNTRRRQRRADDPDWRARELERGRRRYWRDAEQRDRRPFLRRCAFCGDSFETFHPRQKYCRGRHKRLEGERRVKAKRQAVKASTRIGGEVVSLRVVGPRDGWRCHVCGRKVREADGSIDHLVPLAVGGPHTLANVALAHLRCNQARGARGVAQLRLV